MSEPSNTMKKTILSAISRSVGRYTISSISKVRLSRMDYSALVDDAQIMSNDKTLGFVEKVCGIRIVVDEYMPMGMIALHSGDDIIVCNLTDQSMFKFHKALPLKIGGKTKEYVMDFMGK